MKRLCDYGCGNEGLYLIKSSNKWSCCKSSNSCPANKLKNSLGCKKSLKKDRAKPSGLKGKASWNKGKKLSEDFRKKVSLGMKGKNTWKSIPEEKKLELRKKRSEQIKERYAKGWQPKSGRCKKIQYESLIAGHVLLDGSWELEFAKYLDKNNIKWKRNTERFSYSYKGERKYTPDFYLIDFDVYIEIKGYKTEKDEAKWNQFRKKI